MSAVPFRATYRVQLHKGFTFRDATEIVPYIAALGFSHLYCSPIMKARPGSTHGYDIVDHNQLNPEIGTETEFDSLVEALHRHDMGVLLDIVPNHMAVGPDNGWWMDVLEWGRLSPYAAFFDINWSSSRSQIDGKVLLPVLGEQYGIVLENGELELRFEPETGSFSTFYYDTRFPIAPFDYPTILKPAIAVLDGTERHELLEACSVFAGLGKLRQDVPRLREQADAGKQRLAQLAATSPKTAEAIGKATMSYAGRKDDRESWFTLGGLLDRQSYRPAHWRVASDEINYRRFFNINDLGGIRIERRDLFEETHRKTFRMIEDGKIDGLRIDHIDGLFDPKEYLERVQARVGRPGQPFYVVVEKILAHYEELPEDWPVAGTSGYDTINLLGTLFVDPVGERALTTHYRRFSGRRDAFDDILYASKKRIMSNNLASEVGVLAEEMHRLSSSHWRSRDYSLNRMRIALVEVMAHFPVYRTYVDRDATRDTDRRYIDWAIGIAKKRATEPDASIYDFLRSVLTGELSESPEYPRDDVLFLAMRFQQLSGPVMAKGLEDTSFYRYFRLIALNEVGGDPRRFSVSTSAFHHQNEQRLKRHPLDMLGGSTHDTKRGEDARARLVCLSGVADEWRQRTTNWARLNRRFKAEIDGLPAPDRNDEYYVYQTLIGVWPIELEPTDVEGLADLSERVEAALIKAVREGKEKSSWNNPDEAYEQALTSFARRCLDASRPNPFLPDFYAFLARIAHLGALTSVSQTLLRLTMPGVPDIYRGAELWDLSLVDPDNRRPVDYQAYRERSDAIAGYTPSPESAHAVAATWPDARIKLLAMSRALALRRQRPNLFASGNYVPLPATGERADNIVGFSRTTDDAGLIAVAPRFWPTLWPADAPAPTWGDTTLTLPAGDYVDAFTGRRWETEGAAVSLAALLEHFPVTLLIRR